MAYGYSPEREPSHKLVPEMGFGFDLSFFLFSDFRFWRCRTARGAERLYRAERLQSFAAGANEAGVVAGRLGERCRRRRRPWISGSPASGFALQGGHDGLKVLEIFTGRDGAAGRQAMGDDVMAGGGFAFACTRAGGELGVAAVGLDLCRWGLHLLVGLSADRLIRGLVSAAVSTRSWRRGGVRS